MGASRWSPIRTAKSSIERASSSLPCPDNAAATWHSVSTRTIWFVAECSVVFTSGRVREGPGVLALGDQHRGVGVPGRQPADRVRCAATVLEDGGRLVELTERQLQQRPLPSATWKSSLPAIGGGTIPSASSAAGYSACTRRYRATLGSKLRRASPAVCPARRADAKCGRHQPFTLGPPGGVVRGPAANSWSMRTTAMSAHGTGEARKLAGGAQQQRMDDEHVSGHLGQPRTCEAP